MNEEHMCNYCSTGRILLMQINLNEAISICDNSKCDCYLQELPTDCVVSKPYSSGSNYITDIFSRHDEDQFSSNYSISSYTSAASRSSSADREVEHLLNQSCLSKFNYHNEDPPHQWFSQANCNNNNQDKVDPRTEDETLIVSRAMTHSVFDIPGIPHVIKPVSQETSCNANEEFLDLLNSNDNSSTNSITKQHDDTILDEALSSFLENLDSDHMLSALNDPNNAEDVTSKETEEAHCDRNFSGMFPGMNLKSAFIRITPHRSEEDVENVNVKRTEPCSKELCLQNCKKITDPTSYLNEPNFLSPVSSGISEDSGFNDEEVVKGYRAINKSAFVSPNKDKISAAGLSIVNNSDTQSHYSVSDIYDNSLPKISMSKLFTFLELNTNLDLNSCPNTKCQNINLHSSNSFRKDKNFVTYYKENASQSFHMDESINKNGTEVLQNVNFSYGHVECNENLERMVNSTNYSEQSCLDGIFNPESLQSAITTQNLLVDNDLMLKKIQTPVDKERNNSSVHCSSNIEKLFSSTCSSSQGANVGSTDTLVSNSSPEESCYGPSVNKLYDIIGFQTEVNNSEVLTIVQPSIGTQLNIGPEAQNRNGQYLPLENDDSLTSRVYNKAKDVDNCMEGGSIFDTGVISDNNLICNDDTLPRTGLQLKSDMKTLENCFQNSNMAGISNDDKLNLAELHPYCEILDCPQKESHKSETRSDAIKLASESGHAGEQQVSAAEEGRRDSDYLTPVIFHPVASLKKTKSSISNDRFTQLKEIISNSDSLLRRKSPKKGHFTVDPWSVPELYLDELNIEVILGSKTKNSEENQTNCISNEHIQATVEDVTNCVNRHEEDIHRLNYNKKQTNIRNCNIGRTSSVQKTSFNGNTDSSSSDQYSITNNKNLHVSFNNINREYESSTVEKSCSEEVDNTVLSGVSRPILKSYSNNVGLAASISSSNVNIFKPVTLYPEVLDISVEEILYDTAGVTGNLKPVRLSVGHNFNQKTLSSDCVSENEDAVTVNGFRKASYFDTLLSTVEFDKLMLPIKDTEAMENNMESLLSESFLGDAFSETTPKENLLTSETKLSQRERKSAKGCKTSKIKYLQKTALLKTPIISVDANDEPQIYAPRAKRKVKMPKKKNDIAKKCDLKNTAISCEENLSVIENRENNSSDDKFCHYTQVGYNSKPCTKEHKYLRSCLQQQFKEVLPEISLQYPYSNKSVNSRSSLMMRNLPKFGNLNSSPEHFTDYSILATDGEEEGCWNSFDLSSYLSSECKESTPSPLIPAFENSRETAIREFESKTAFLRLRFKRYLSTRTYSRANNKLKESHSGSMKSIENELLDKYQSNASSGEAVVDAKSIATIPRYMKYALRNVDDGNSSKEINKHNLLNKKESMVNKTNLKCSNMPFFINPNSSESEILGCLKDLGWTVSPCSPSINYQVPSHAVSPTIVPQALMEQYGNTGSDVVMWSLIDPSIAVSPPPLDKIQENSPFEIETDIIRKNQRDARNHTEKKLNGLNCTIKNRKSKQSLQTLKHKIIKKVVPLCNPRSDKLRKFLLNDFSMRRNNLTLKKEASDHVSGSLNNKNKSYENGIASKQSLTTLKIGNNHIVLPKCNPILREENSRAAHHYETQYEDLVGNEAFIELPDDFSAYEQVTDSGFYTVAAPPTELPSFRIPPPSPSPPPPKKKRADKKTHLIKNSKKAKYNHDISNVVETKPMQKPAEDGARIRAEETLTDIIKHSDQPPSFFCVTHAGKTYVYHRED